MRVRIVSILIVSLAAVSFPLLVTTQEPSVIQMTVQELITRIAKQAQEILETTPSKLLA